MIVRWTFAEVWSPLSYTFLINPNEGGSPSFEKQMNIKSSSGPHQGGIIQEGRMLPPELQFSGVLLTQEHYEGLESWYVRRVLLDLNDDIGRTFRGAFSTFNPQRERRAYNPWYHKYSAQFAVLGYRNASGQIVFGFME